MTRMRYYPTRHMKDCCCSYPKMADCETSVYISRLVGKWGFLRYDRHNLFFYGKTYDDTYSQPSSGARYGGLSFMHLQKDDERIVLCNGKEIFKGAAAFAPVIDTALSVYHPTNIYQHPIVTARYSVINTPDNDVVLCYCGDYEEPKEVGRYSGVSSSNYRYSHVGGSTAFFSKTSEYQMIFYNGAQAARRGPLSAAHGQGGGYTVASEGLYTFLHHDRSMLMSMHISSVSYSAPAILSPYYAKFGRTIYYIGKHLTGSGETPTISSGSSVYANYRFLAYDSDSGKATMCWDGAAWGSTPSWRASTIVEAGRQVCAVNGGPSASVWYEGEIKSHSVGYSYTNIYSEGGAWSYGNYLVVNGVSGSEKRWKVIYKNNSISSGTGSFLYNTTAPAYSDFDTICWTVGGTTYGVYQGETFYEGSGTRLRVAGKSVAIKEGNRLKIYNAGKLKHNRQYDDIADIASRNGVLFVKADDYAIIYDEEFGLLKHRLPA